MSRRKRLACSFCGKDEADVAKLVAGPNVYICDECVAAATRIIRDVDAEGSTVSDDPPPAPRR